MKFLGKFAPLLPLRQVATASAASLLGSGAVLPNPEGTCWHDRPMQGHCRGPVLQSTENPCFVAGAAAFSDLIHGLITVVLKVFENIFECI